MPEINFKRQKINFKLEHLGVKIAYELLQFTGKHKQIKAIVMIRNINVMITTTESNKLDVNSI